MTVVSVEADFARDTDRFRRELLAHCYRMLGSVDDAEDAVQETYLRAWRGYPDFAGRSSPRTWLYRIATRVCLDAVAHHSRRVLPSGIGAPTDHAEPDRGMAGGPASRIQPMADRLIGIDETPDPAEQIVRRESVRLALVAALQQLPARQRASLLLREVLGMSAGETADILGVTVPAVKSMLQRARARMADQPGLRNERAHDLQPGRRAWLLEQYLTAFERSDPAMLERVLTEDARLELPPDGWFSGKQDCMTVLREAVGRPGDWRMLPDSFNGRPGVAAYLRDAAGRHQAYGIAVLEVTEDGINAITVFGEPDLLTRFGFPAAA